MPTKPSKHAKHGKDYLDEAVAKSTYHAKPITRKRATVSGVLGVLLGFTGIHNWIMRRKKRAFMHSMISAIGFFMFFLPIAHGVIVVYNCRHGFGCEDMRSYSDIFNILVIAGFAIFGFSLIWGIVEGITILTHLSHYEKSAK